MTPENSDGPLLLLCGISRDCAVGSEVWLKLLQLNYTWPAVEFFNHILYTLAFMGEVILLDYLVASATCDRWPTYFEPFPCGDCNSVPLVPEVREK